MTTDTPGRLQFGVLGPLVVWRGGEPVGLGGGRQRTLLALLLVHANEFVNVEALVEALFGEQVSESAVNAARVAVSRLRRVLEHGGEGRVLESRSGGYVLCVAPEQLDAAMFERLLSDGRRLLAAGDAVSAAARLREGLGPWRGPPLADLALAECLQTEIRRLEELRLLALMERIDANLALGGGGELVADLETLIVSDPHAERLRGQLMLALYRAGRQTDALTVYRELSDRLRDELGLKPSRSLQHLERMILQQDPSLDAAPRLASTASATPGAQGNRVVAAARAPTPTGSFPLAATPFLGRAREVAEVRTLLRRGDIRLLTLTGAGGSGKTRLAVHIAQSCAQDYLDGAWFVGFSDIIDSDLLAPAICQALGLADQPDVTPTRRLREWFAERSLLLVLDNLEQLAHGTAPLGELLSACPRLRLLVTSREPLHLAGEQQYEVPVLERADAVELFTTRAHAIAPRADINAKLAGDICALLDYLPLAIELAAARTKALPPGDILARLKRRVPVLGAGPRDAPRRHQTLQATIGWSYDLLSETEQQLFRRLGVFAGGCTLSAAETVCNADLDTLQALTDRSLITSNHGRYGMLQTHRQYALERLERADEAGEFKRLHAQWCARLLEIKPFWFAPDAPFHASLLDPEGENCRGALEWAAENGQSETVARIAASLTGFVWYRRGQLNEAERWLRLARLHRQEHPLSLQANVLSAARRLAWGRGENEQGAALCEQALAIYRDLGDPIGICAELLARGLFASEHGNLVAARAALEELILYAREHDVLGFVPTALMCLADFAIEEGRLDDAKTLSEEGLILADELGVTADKVVGFVNLAHIANLQGRHGDAVGLGRSGLTSALTRAHSLTATSAVMEIAWPLAELGQPERSGRLLGAAIGFREHAGSKLRRTEKVCEERTTKILRDQLDASKLQALLDQGRKMPLEEAARDALNESPGGHTPQAPVTAHASAKHNSEPWHSSA